MVAATVGNEEEAEEEDGDKQDEAVKVVHEQCIALLDEPDRFLTMRRTTALALATLHEALAQAQQDSMPHEEDSMAIVVQHLERLERLVVTRFDGCQGSSSSSRKRAQHIAAEERALLTHLGRGVELAALIAKQQQRHGGD